MALTQVTSIGLKDGEIVNADLHSEAAIVLSKLNTTGTASSSTFLRGDGAWTAISADGGNAATLDSIDSSQFLRSDADDTASGKISFTSSSDYPVNINGSDDAKILLQGSNDPYIRFREGSTNKAYIQWNASGYLEFRNQEDDSKILLRDDIVFSSDGSTLHKIWHAGNDGTGSGLDADTLDGTQAAKFLSSYDRTTTTGWEDSNRNFRINGGSTGSAGLAFHDSAGTFQWQIYGASGSSQYGFLSANWGSWDIRKVIGGALYVNSGSQVWHAGNDGAGSGLDADLWDGNQFSSYLNQAVLTTSDVTHAKVIATNWLRNDGSGEGLYNQATACHFHSAGANYWHINSASGITAGGLIFYSGYNGTHGGSTGRQGYVYFDTNGFGLLSDDGSWAYRHNNTYADIYGTLRRDASYTIWDSGNDGSGSGLDADTVDGIQGASFLRSDADDTFSGGLVSNARDEGIFGTYDSYKTDHIWSMGTSYKNHSSGTNFGNLYGLAYKHTNNSTGGTMGGSHQMVWCGNGEPKGAIGYSCVWHREAMKVGTSYHTVFHQGNDGSGSGLDADTVDGYEGSRLVINNTSNTVTGSPWQLTNSGTSSWGYRFINSTGTNNSVYMAHGTHGMHIRNDSCGTGQYLLQVYGSNGTDFMVRGGDALVTSGGNTMWHAGNDGSGSGLDADTVDGVQLDSLVRKGHNSNYILHFGSGTDSNHVRSSHPYAIFQEDGAWSGTYPDLCISYHTGIKIGCGYQGYGGLRFTPDYNSETILMSINNGTETNGNGNVKVNTKLYVSSILDCSSTVRSDDWYYNDTNGLGLYNAGSTQHFYSDHDDVWNLAGGTSANWIRFRDESGGTIRGYVGANNSNLIGFLDYEGNFAFSSGKFTNYSHRDLVSQPDDGHDLGYGNRRWDNVYATNGTIQTSDRNEKENIVATDLGLDFVNKLNPVSFKRKGKTRTHYGFIAQDIEQIITDLGKTTTQFAPLIKSDISEAKDGSEYRYGLRYEQLLAPVVKAIQELAVKVAALESA